MIKSALEIEELYDLIKHEAGEKRVSIVEFTKALLNGSAPSYLKLEQCGYPVHLLKKS